MAEWEKHLYYAWLGGFALVGAVTMTVYAMAMFEKVSVTLPSPKWMFLVGACIGYLTSLYRKT